MSLVILSPHGNGDYPEHFPHAGPPVSQQGSRKFLWKFFLSDLNVGHSHLSVNDSENKFWALLLYGSGSGSPKGTQRWEGLREGRLGAKEELGGIPLSSKEMAILGLPRIAAFLALIYLCNQRKHLPNSSVNLSWAVSDFTYSVCHGVVASSKRHSVVRPTEEQSRKRPTISGIKARKTREASFS